MANGLQRMLSSFGAVARGAFITSWKTDNSGDTTDHQIQLPTVSTGTYDFIVDWGDGNTDHITAYNDAAITHTYASIGTYTVVITGVFIGIGWSWWSGISGDYSKFINISQWGILELGNEQGYFGGCDQLTITATDILDLTGTTDLTGTFDSCASITTIPNINSWDVSAVTVMADMFGGATLFNDNIDGWDVSVVTDMNNMFSYANTFNQNLNDWDVSAVTDMSSIFNNVSMFNGNISNWNVGTVLNMQSMFNGAVVFNQNIGGWNTTSVTNMQSMFNGATIFNQDIGDWNTGAVTNMNNMFNYATSFNQNINTWDVGNVNNPQAMFNNATAFNQDVNSWDTSAFTNTFAMFQNATSFDQDIGSWDVTSLTFAQSMFSGVTLSTSNYNSLLAGWGAQSVQTGVTFDGGNSHYDATTGAHNGTAGRLVLTAIKSWTITDGGTP